MTEGQWKSFSSFREEFRDKVLLWSNRIKNLSEIQAKVAKESGAIYPVECPLVYNTALDELTIQDDIKLIVIGDNPGKEEQYKKNNRYLVGQAGRIAEGFFRRKDELGIDFRKNVVILNKTPIHSGKTIQLKKISSYCGQEFDDFLLETQIWMSEKTAKLHQDLIKHSLQGHFIPELWLVGYSELNKKGLFCDYAKKLKKSYDENISCWDKVFYFQHFSMNRFTIDLNDFVKKNELFDLYEKKPLECIHKIGQYHKNEIYKKIEEE